MTASRLLLRILALGALAGPPLTAVAHDFWLEPAGDGLTLRYGHRGGELLAIEASRVKTARCLEGGTSRDLLPGATFSGREVRFAGRCQVASAFYDGGTWTLTPDGEVNQPKNQVQQAVKAWASRQFAKWVDARSATAPRAVFGDELEVVAVSSLQKAREGDKVTLQVLSKGKPVADAVVAVDHKALGETDSAGEVRVRLRTSGIETISATLRRPLQTPEADALVLEATLSFEVAK
jgi:nickel transport protein